MRTVITFQPGWPGKSHRMLMALALAVVLVGGSAFLTVASATQAAEAAQVDTYSWPSAPCAWNGETTGTCSGYDWGVKTCPPGDSYCTAGNEINGYYQYDKWGYGFRNCTSYVAEKISQEFGGRSVAGWGNASNWVIAAQNAGYHLDTLPEVGDIAVWKATTGSSYGHVAYVYAVSNGVASFDEYNAAMTGAFTSSYTSANHFGGVPTSYIHMGTPADSGGGGRPLVWGVNSAGAMYRYDGGGKWERMGGAMAEVSVGDDGLVWGVNAAGAVYRYDGGGKWERMGGPALAEVSVGSLNGRGLVWGVNVAGAVYRYDGGGKWERMGGAMAEVSVGDDGLVWGVNAAGAVYRYDGGGKWERMGGPALAQVSVGSS